ncbi:MAG TPA: CehA/McbA family metallohydrolase [Vicinamibacterales bacterium]|nr:CehA/McbA family metallohydrolase [Vicinamibacterales bacterium]
MRRPSPRASALLLLLLGAAAGSVVDRISPRAVVRAGEFIVLSGDFHVHAFPGDGALSPWMLRDEAARAGLDVIAVTNHNQSFTGRLAGRVSDSGDGPLMLAGQEVTNPDYHMIAAGIVETVNAFQPAAGAIADIQKQGGVAIAAHPSRRFHGYDSDVARGALDGAEAAHSDIHRDPVFRSDLASFFARARTVNPGIAAIGSSDFHAMPPVIGRCRTYLFVRERTKGGVLDAIRAGRTLAVDGDGRLTGDPSLIQLLGDARPAGRSDLHPFWRRLSMTMAWLGALGLVVLRAGWRPQAQGLRAVSGRS